MGLSQALVPLWINAVRGTNHSKAQIMTLCSQHFMNEVHPEMQLLWTKEFLSSYSPCMADRMEWENPEILQCPHFKTMGPTCVLPLHRVLNLGFPPPKGAVWIWAGKYYNIFFTNLLLKCSISLYHACGQQTTVVLSVPDILWAIKITGIFTSRLYLNILFTIIITLKL